jgi:hypothetical protein
MRQQLERDERDEKGRHRKELLLMFLRVIACCVGIVLAVWLAVNYFDLDLNKYTERYSSEGLVFSGIGLAIVAYLVDFVIKGIKTGELRAYDGKGWSHITKKKNEPKMFWFFVYINLVSVLGILIGIFYWVFIGAG